MFARGRIVPMLLCAVAVAALAPAALASVSFDLFISELTPHGQWAVSASYGRVWQPFVARGAWSPYREGHWVQTDLGQTWVSDYKWGVLPYHYGTWALDPLMGWVWVPGYTWAPAWVVFRTGPGVVGWAPVPPRFQVGMTIDAMDCPDASFVFVPAAGFLKPRLRGTFLTPNRVRGVFPQTRIVNRSLRLQGGVLVNRAVSDRQLRRVSGRAVRPVPIERCPGLGRHVRWDEIAVGPSHRLDGLRATQPVRVMRETDPQDRRAAAEARRREECGPSGNQDQGGADGRRGASVARTGEGGRRSLSEDGDQNERGKD